MRVDASIVPFIVPSLPRAKRIHSGVIHSVLSGGHGTRLGSSEEALPAIAETRQVAHRMARAHSRPPRRSRPAPGCRRSRPIHEVVADIEDAAAEIVLVVHWIGGVHSEICLPKRRRGQRNSTSADVITAVRQLVLIADDDLIAGILNRNGQKTGNGNRWTRERVTSMRSRANFAVLELGGFPGRCQ